MTLRQSAVGGTLRWRLREMVAVGATVLAAVALLSRPGVSGGFVWCQPASARLAR
jgi:hypothetical protein